MMCMVFKNWVWLCWHSWLLYNCNSKWSSDSVMTILLLFFCCTCSTIIIILAHSYFYPCLSEMFFKNYLFCNKLRRSLKFQHAVNPSGPDLFQCKPLTLRLSFTESCMISTGRTQRNCLNLSNQEKVRTLTGHFSSALLAFSTRAEAQCRSVEHYSCWLQSF